MLNEIRQILKANGVFWLFLLTYFLWESEFVKFLWVYFLQFWFSNPKCIMSSSTYNEKEKKLMCLSTHSWANIILHVCTISFNVKRSNCYSNSNQTKCRCNNKFSVDFRSNNSYILCLSPNYVRTSIWKARDILNVCAYTICILLVSLGWRGKKRTSI